MDYKRSGFAPVPYEKSVVLGGGHVLFPIEKPAVVAAELHLFCQALWNAAYKAGREDKMNEIKKALEL